MSRLLLLTALVCAFVGEARAQDPLDQASRELSVKAQRVVREVNLSFTQARAVERSNPERARDILRQSKALLEDDIFLPEQQRRDLLRQVNNRLAAVGAQVAAQKRADELAAKQTDDRQGREARQRDNDRRAAQSGPSAVAGTRISSAQDTLAKVDELRQRRNGAYRGVFESIEAAATPINGVIEYPKYWKQISENRKQKLDPREVALLKALNSTLSVDFQGTPFNEVIDYLQDKTGQAIIIDENSLKDAMIESNDPVKFKVPKVTVRTILRKVLADRGLAYIIRDGTIQVVSAQKARETTVVRSYPVSDLVGADPAFYGFFTPLVMQQNAQNLINMIQSAVEPSYWQANGGPGTITFHPQSRSIVVRASAEIHYMFGGTGLLDR